MDLVHKLCKTLKWVLPGDICTGTATALDFFPETDYNIVGDLNMAQAMDQQEDDNMARPQDSLVSDAKVINPDHYRPENSTIEAVDVIEVFFVDDAHLSHAFKYMSRAGKKDDNDYTQDIEKAIWWLQRAVKHHDENYS